jgi:hypothetical protein
MVMSASELAQLQKDVAAVACDLPCQIQRSNITYGAPGTPAVIAWPTVSQPGLLCGMTEPSAGQLTNYEYMIGSLAAWHIRFPVGTDVRELDRLVITENSGLQRTLSVVKLLQPRSYSTLISVLATE